MKIAIVTALTGNNENLVNPVVIHKDVDYHAFVDREWPNATVWKKHKLYHYSSEGRFAARRNAKPYKLNPFAFLQGYDAYIWVDVSHDVVADPHKIFSTFLLNADMACFRHTTRNCVYEEAKIIKELDYDHHELVDAQMNYYRSKNFPENYGLFEMSTFAMRDSDNTRILAMKWMDQVSKFSSRDQLSFPFCAWETGLTISVLPGFANGFNYRGTIGNNDYMPQTRQHVSSGPK
jgi:hypothetical protein